MGHSLICTLASHWLILSLSFIYYLAQSFVPELVGQLIISVQFYKWFESRCRCTLAARRSCTSSSNNSNRISNSSIIITCTLTTPWNVKTSASNCGQIERTRTIRTGTLGKPMNPHSDREDAIVC